MTDKADKDKMQALLRERRALDAEIYRQKQAGNYTGPLGPTSLQWPSIIDKPFPPEWNQGRPISPEPSTDSRPK